MPPWSKASWPQWIGRLRDAMLPVSVIGVRPAASSSGMLSREALMMPLMRVGGADGDVHHHRRRLAGNAVVAVRHRHGDVLVRHHDEARRLGALALRQRLHDRGEIGSGIGEDILDAALAEPRDIGFRRHAVRGLAVVHGRIHPLEVRARRKVTARPASVNEAERMGRMGGATSFPPAACGERDRVGAQQGGSF